MRRRENFLELIELRARVRGSIAALLAPAAGPAVVAVRRTWRAAAACAQPDERKRRRGVRRERLVVERTIAARRCRLI